MYYIKKDILFSYIDILSYIYDIIGFYLVYHNILYVI